MVFNGVTLTAESIAAARQQGAQLCQSCIDEVIGGQVYVNDPEQYVRWRREQIGAHLSGAYDGSVAFMQKAYWIQTGEDVAILP